MKKMTTESNALTVSTSVNASIEKVWEYWTDPQHVTQWNQASDDWHCPRGENDLRVAGKFSYRMEAKDGSFGFDFGGVYTSIESHRIIEYTMDDGRKVKVNFAADGGATKVTESFDAESTHSIEMQRNGWQAILNNFKKYAESIPSHNKLRFQIAINAPVEKVYKTMIHDDTYRAWTSEFNPSSYFEGTWEKGSKILFIGSDQNGNKGGMVSRIKDNIPHKLISIEHVGILKGDEEITSGAEVEAWKGSLENYSFVDVDGKTLLKIEMDSNDEFKEYFETTWPKALNKLKIICEA